MTAVKRFYLTADRRGRRAVGFDPTDRPISLRLYTGDEAGIGSSGVPVVELEQQHASGLNRVVTHVTLRDAATGRTTPVLRLVGRAEPSLDRPDVDESKVDQPGTYIETTSGHWLPLEDALRILDQAAKARQEGRTLVPSITAADIVKQW